MDGLDLFRKLSSGAKFNLKRFGNDAQKLQVINPAVRAPSTVSSSPQRPQQLPRKRKKEAEVNGGKPKKKKGDDENSDGSDDDDDSDDDSDDESYEGEDNKPSSGDSDSQSGNSASDADSAEDDQGLQLLGNIKSHGSQEVRLDKRNKKSEGKKSVEKLAALKQEEINHSRKLHHIHVYGTDIPNPVGSFAELHADYAINPQILTNLATYGYNEPTPIQMQAIPAMLHRREVLACAPTGSGKTAAFIVPLLHHLRGPEKKGFRAVVLSPTRELAKQTHREFVRLSEGLGFRIYLIEKASTAIKKFGPQSSQKFDILVTTPNRLVYLLNQDPLPIRLNNVEWLVVDESDKLFEEGKTGFRDQLAAVYQACDSSQVRRALFSATFAFQVEEWCRLNLDNVVQVHIGARNAATCTVKQELVFVGGEAGKLIAMQDVIQKSFTPPVLVFVQSKERAKELFHELIYDGINVDVIHSDRTQTQRDNIVNGFRSGKIWVLICTELMGRGIDFKGVNLVINYDFPTSAVNYIHRIGRTGRAGREGRAVTFFTEDDLVNLRSIANVMKEAGCPVPDYMLTMTRPNKNERRKLARNAVNRKSIRTISQEALNDARVKRKMIRHKTHLGGKGPSGDRRSSPQSSAKRTPQQQDRPQGLKPPASAQLAPQATAHKAHKTNRSSQDKAVKTKKKKTKHVDTN